MLGSGVARHADVAMWTVGERAVNWAAMVGTRISAVDLHYVPWTEGDEGQWCPHITFHGEHARVDVVIGDARDGQLVPSADNVAVLHAGTALFAWITISE